MSYVQPTNVLLKKDKYKTINDVYGSANQVGNYVLGDPYQRMMKEASFYNAYEGPRDGESLPLRLAIATGYGDIQNYGEYTANAFTYDAGTSPMTHSRATPTSGDKFYGRSMPDMSKEIDILIAVTILGLTIFSIQMFS